MNPRGEVSNPPEKPLVVFDGDCHFCRRWIERWREMTGGAVEYENARKLLPRLKAA